MKEQEKMDFLVKELCDSEEEVKELKEWINRSGLNQVYDRIRELFYEEEDD